MKRFEGKLVLVVGVASGIGLATAKRLSREGAKIVGVGRDNERLQNALVTLEGSGHHGIVADVAVEEQMKPIVKYGKEQGGYSGAVCCAGLHEVRPLSLLKPDNLIASFIGNTIPAINCAKSIAKATHQEGAGVVWMSSVAAIRGTAGFTAYSCAKGALISAAKVAAVELSKKKIRVNVVTAGVVETPMSEGWLGLLSQEQRDEVDKTHLLGIGKPEDVADAIAFLVSSDSRWITGSSVVVDGGLSVR